MYTDIKEDLEKKGPHQQMQRGTSKATALIDLFSLSSFIYVILILDCVSIIHFLVKSFCDNYCSSFHM